MLLVDHIFVEITTCAFWVHQISLGSGDAEGGFCFHSLRLSRILEFLFV